MLGKLEDWDSVILYSWEWEKADSYEKKIKITKKE